MYLGGPTIQEVDGKMMKGVSIYGVAVISGSVYSRFYGISTGKIEHFKVPTFLSQFLIGMTYLSQFLMV